MLIILRLLIVSVKAVIWPCSTTDDCKTVAGAECSEFGSCSCSKGYLLSEDITKCVKEATYGEECEETIQCGNVSPGTKCTKNKCQCGEGYQYVGARCRKYNNLNEACVQNDDCFFGYDKQSVQCQSGFCKCANGYYERFSNICRKKSNVGGLCVVNEDCQSDGIVCLNFLCQEQDQPDYIFVKLDDDLINRRKSAAIKDDTLKISHRIQAGDRCTNYKEQCAGLENSICADGVCACQLGYYVRNGQCFAALGEKVNNEELCENFYDEDSKLCLCQENYFYEPGLRECRKPIAPIEGRCVSDSQCSPFGASYCRLERPRLCECKKYATYNETRQMCVAAEGLGSYCDESAPCLSPNSICSANNACICKPMYMDKTGICVPGLGADCRTTTECGAENSVCDGNLNVCTCGENYVEVGPSCLRKANSVGDDCVNNAQCQPLMGGFAICENNKCTCDDESHLKRNQCFKKKLVGDNCITSLECFSLDNSTEIECRNSICQCLFGYTIDGKTRTCINERNSAIRQNGLFIISITFGLLILIFK